MGYLKKGLALFIYVMHAITFLIEEPKKTTKTIDEGITSGKDF
jgi:hypothetical protein